MFLPSGDIRVTLEMPDGTIYSAPATCVSISVDNQIRSPEFFGEESLFPYPALGEPLGWSMELRGHSLVFEQREEFIEEVRREATALEWKCDWCSAVNPKAARKCEACGGWRSFLYAQ